MKHFHYIFWSILFLSFFGDSKMLNAQVDPIWWDEVKITCRRALSQGEYQKALHIFENSMQDLKRRKHAASYYYEGLGFFSAMYESMGNLPMALEYAKERMEFGKKANANRFAEPEADLLAYAKLSMRAREWPQAETAIDSLCQIIGPQLAQEPLLYAEISTLLGETYLQQGKYKEAVQSFEASAAITAKYYKRDHPAFADALNRTAYACMQAGKDHKALVYSDQALKIYEKQAGGTDICAFCLNNMAICAQRIKQNQAAEGYYQDALSIYRRIYGPNHPNCVSIRNNLGILYEQSGQMDKAASLLGQSVQELLSQIDYFYRELSEAERLHFYRTQIVNNIDAFYSFVSRQPDSSLLLLMQEINLRTKNAASYTSSRLKNIVISQQDAELEKLYNQWYGKRQLISQIYGWPQEKLKARHLNISQLELEARELERKMAAESKAISSELNKDSLNMAGLQHRLKAGEASIDFIHFHYRKADGWTDSIMYYAIISKADEDLPKLVALSTAKKLRYLLREEVKQGSATTGKSNNYVMNTTKSEYLYNAVWAPLEPHLKGIKRLHISPSGWLCQLSFGVLQNEKGTHLADQYQIHYYAAMRDYVYPDKIKTATENRQAILFGGIDFDAEILEPKPTIEAFESLEASPELLKSGSSEAWEYLKESKTEVETIAGKLQESGFECLLMTGADAREDSLKSFLTKAAPKVLHLATHGYFIAAARRYAAANELQGLRDKLQYEPHPLWRSGLLLAGANAAWLGDEQLPGLMDGILPAYDIAALNLQQTELVVLSACQTGRGDIDNTEGVQGLQSAFRQAGVHYQLLTLWNVSDAAAAKMMELFYTHYLSGKRIPESFEEAVKELRAIPRFSSPFYWGAFVLIE